MSQLPQLQSLSSLLSRAIASETIPGALVLLSHRGRTVHHEAQGVIDRKIAVPLQADSVFWLASLTKPIIAAGLLILSEQGRLRLQDPVSCFIPEFAQPRSVRIWEGGTLPPFQPVPAPNLSVVIPNDPPHRLVAAERELSLLDLLTHTSGLQTIGVPNGAVPAIGPGDTLASHVARLAAVPLDFQPGTRWAYSNAVGYDVLARVIEVASGQTLPEFLQQQLLGPLGMQQTSFGQSAHPRAWPLDPRLPASPVVAGTHYFSGAAGLWSCATDYARFGQMLLNRGELAGVRVLQPDSVAQMTRNQVGTLFPGLTGRPRGQGGLGFGLGVACVLDPEHAGTALPQGSFGWDGMGTRRFWVAPALDLVLVMYAPSASVQADVEAAASTWARLRPDAQG